MMDEQGTLPPVTPEALEELRRLLRAHGISLAGVSSTVTERKTEHDLLKLQVEMLERKVDTQARCLAQHVTDMHKPEHNPTVRLDPNDPDSITATPTATPTMACDPDEEDEDPDVSGKPLDTFGVRLHKRVEKLESKVSKVPRHEWLLDCLQKQDTVNFEHLDKRLRAIETNGMAAEVLKLRRRVDDWASTWTNDRLVMDERLTAVEKRAADLLNGEAGQCLTDIDGLCERLTLLEDRTNARWGTDKDEPHGEDKDAPHGADKERGCRRIYGARPNKPMTEKEQRYARAELLYGKLETPETRQKENRDLVDDAIEGLLTSLDRDHGVHIVGRVRRSVIDKARNAAGV